jgi:hypothetical protein
MFRSSTERRLRDASDQLRRARHELGVVEQQLAALAEDADDTRVRALVADSPAADREHLEAQRHADAMERTRQSLVASIAELQRLQDQLLDRLVVEPR